MWQSYVNAQTVDHALAILAEQGAAARIVAGATDLMLELERGVRTGIHTLVDITRIPGLDTIHLDEAGRIHLGPLVTHNDCAASSLVVQRAFPLARAAWEVGAPQIRNRGTVAGNLITASPANDTIAPLMALDAVVVLQSSARQRSVPLREFYRGVRKTVMQPDEMLVDIHFPALQAHTPASFIKLGLRRAQAISIVNAAAVVEMEGDMIHSARITLGAVAPVIVHAAQAEAFLVGRALTPDVIEQAAALAVASATPIDDLRGSAAYRRRLVQVGVARLLHAFAAGNWREGFLENSPLLVDPAAAPARLPGDAPASPLIHTTINGRAYTFSTGMEKSLLRLLREEADLIGVKEGCAEGECGACTVFLDGKAVMSCLVPAPRAHLANIVTIEGLADADGSLHPVQQAFLETGAVQCGYCTPGFIMSAAMLLAENPQPEHAQIQQALTGNLCRCTGYYKIIEAVDRAARRMEDHRHPSTLAGKE
jgi:carbon-monoxide dehydrogenase medium subunit